VSSIVASPNGAHKKTATTLVGHCCRKKSGRRCPVFDLEASVARPDQPKAENVPAWKMNGISEFAPLKSRD
jgi:hypothetical protein